MTLDINGRLSDERHLRIGHIGCGGHSFTNLLPTLIHCPVNLVAISRSCFWFLMVVDYRTTQCWLLAMVSKWAVTSRLPVTLRSTRGLFRDPSLHSVK